MLGEPSVFFLVPLELLLPVALQSTIDVVFAIWLKMIGALNDKEIFVVCDALGVDGDIVTLAVGKKINRIQNVGLARSVASDETIDFRRERYFCLTDILEVEKCKLPDEHRLDGLLSKKDVQR